METKKCFNCKTILPLDNFGKKPPTKFNQGVKGYCKKCEQEKVEKSRQKLKMCNPEKYRTKQNKIIKYNVSLKHRNFAFIYRYLRRFGKCADCGIVDIRVLEFDHIKGKKTSGIINLADKLASIQKIKDEIRKCEIRCCNCHRIKTQTELRWRENWKDSWRN